MCFLTDIFKNIDRAIFSCFYSILTRTPRCKVASVKSWWWALLNGTYCCWFSLYYVPFSIVIHPSNCLSKQVQTAYNFELRTASSWRAAVTVSQSRVILSYRNRFSMSTKKTMCDEFIRMPQQRSFRYVLTQNQLLCTVPVTFPTRTGKGTGWCYWLRVPRFI